MPNNHLKDYEKIIRLIGDQLELNPDYAIELLDATFRQILLGKIRGFRDASKSYQEKIQYGRKACFYSEGDPIDLQILAEAYMGTNQQAQALALINSLPKVEMDILKLSNHREDLEEGKNRGNQPPIAKDSKIMENENKIEEKIAVNEVKKWKKDEISDTPDMPKAERENLVNHLKSSKCFLEYGSGGSTILASSLEIPLIYSVDSDKSFLEAVIEKIKDIKFTGTVTSCWVDVGPVHHYGNPSDFTQAIKWPNYCIEPWKKMLKENHSPDLILIDGRFRVPSFLASLALAQKGTVILFDDYKERGNYHMIEKFIKPQNIVGRMAEFIVQESMLTRDLLLELIPSVCLHG